MTNEAREEALRVELRAMADRLRAVAGVALHVDLARCLRLNRAADALMDVVLGIDAKGGDS